MDSSSNIAVSVVLSTYNRCDMLSGALQSISEQTGGVNYELIVVDNNSKDKTREVVESFIRRGHTNFRYVFEEKQGVSHARNAGIAAAQAPYIAFTDDDVLANGDWVAQIKRALDEHPEVSYVGGKVLPRWAGEPPAWLTPSHWSPLALQDHGDAPVYVNSENPICLVGASFCFRREVFERIGLFASELQRVKNSIGSTEDAEFQTRVWNNKMQGLYVPDIVLCAEVQAERLTKAYYRRWHTGHGYYYALMREEDFERSTARLFDVPSHLYGQALRSIPALLRHRLSGREAEALTDELNLRFFAGFFGNAAQTILQRADGARLVES